MDVRRSVMPAMMRGRRKWLAAATTLGCASVLGLVLLEGAIRLTVPVTDQSFLFWDPVLGPRTAPNQSGRLIRGSTFDAHYHFNSQGWNHPRDYVTRKPPGGRRVCLVGDSQVESLQVEPWQTMFAVAESIMSRPERPVEWYSFGASGWGPNVEYEAIRHYVVDYNPDAVVLLFIQNDPFDCSPYLVDVGTYRPVYYLDEAGELVLVPPSPDWRPPRRARIASTSAIFRYFMFQKRLYDRIMAEGNPRPGVGGLPLMAESQIGQKCPVPGVARLSLEERYAKTWELIGKLLAACQRSCRERGALFCVAFRGWSDEIESVLTGARFESPAPEADPWCLAGPRLSEMGRDQVWRITRELGIPYLDLTAALQEAVRRERRSHIFADDNHYNAFGHQVVGEALAAWVEPMLAGAAEARGVSQ